MHNIPDLSISTRQDISGAEFGLSSPVQMRFLVSAWTTTIPQRNKLYVGPLPTMKHVFKVSGTLLSTKLTRRTAKVILQVPSFRNPEH